MNRKIPKEPLKFPVQVDAHIDAKLLAVKAPFPLGGQGAFSVNMPSTCRTVRTWELCIWTSARSAVVSKYLDNSWTVRQNNQGSRGHSCHMSFLNGNHFYSEAALLNAFSPGTRKAELNTHLKPFYVKKCRRVQVHSKFWIHFIGHKRIYAHWRFFCQNAPLPNTPPLFFFCL